MTAGERERGRREHSSSVFIRSGDLDSFPNLQTAVRGLRPFHPQILVVRSFRPRLHSFD